MLIVADENIPLLDRFFDEIGSIRRVAGREMEPQDVADADILLVRSVTRVDRHLLEGSRVKFVGTATIGTDHVDVDWLAEQGIAFASAPGCNAASVAEYVLSVLSIHAEERGEDDWSDLSVGIIGAGNVGQALGRRLTRLGFTVKISDPPRQRIEGEGGFCDLEDVLACDIVTLHTPLTQDGDYPTHHLLNADRLRALTGRQLLINTSRGGVVDTQALLARLQAGDAPQVVLDVWEGEPGVDPDLARAVWLMTPHIAGYSLEGKVGGTEMIYRALCHFLGLPARKQAGQFMADPALSKLSFTSSATALDAAHVAIRACYDVRRDAARYRRVLALPEDGRARAFDAMRRDYPVRREFSSVKIQLKGGAKELQQVFKALEFKLKV
ncbi:4-phosphoerythronate dehydrogenase PdxB [Marinobacter halodurans]|uniref:Erythronate-4-phosphate dehydrogenase n=1 Tax=Marinobacter halodurans TaxID=2528979 RepID=A0ABY1ZS80_9GAMM|nr:4-phosphoerythronate dehydrogenase PdxB [Marinobacter halodurans]TBW59149.1 4-phosphoerythronate dehydrogenase PdxB [Marinobacter halodurans]